MKYLKYIAFTLILFSCEKENTAIQDIAFTRMIGKWVSANSTDDVNIEFRKNGEVKIKYSVERAIIFKTNLIVKDNYGEMINGVEWDEYGFLYQNKKGEYEEGYGFYINSIADTIVNYGLKIENSAANESYVFYTKLN